MPKVVILHSDWGSQYCSTTYQDLLTKHQLICSMSAKGNCYDNTCAESFFHTMKAEATHGEHFTTREEMSHTVFEYIEVDYNRIGTTVQMVVSILLRLKLSKQLN